MCFQLILLHGSHLFIYCNLFPLHSSKFTVTKYDGGKKTLLVCKQLKVAEVQSVCQSLLACAVDYRNNSVVQ